MHPYIDYVNPHLGDLFTKIGLDKQYVRGKDCYLYDQDENVYLDLIAAYGALPFGFNPTEIWEAVHEVESSLEPSLVQPSFLTPAGELARKLVAIAPPGMGKVTFANSGAEAVEAAFKLARAKTGKLGIVSTNNSFHGKTLGALSATGNPSYQRAFGAPLEGFHFVPYGDIEALTEILVAKGDQIAAVILEPIQGEGGIVEPPQGYLPAVRSLCTEHNVLLIFDEIQTGLGRTGQMFAAEAEAVQCDIMTIAKALGGGLIPIGAVLCTDEVYTEEFATKHSSTFAGNSIACRVGLKVVELLLANQQFLIKEVKRKGERLKAGLNQIKDRYPNIIDAIHGRGLMLGIDFSTRRESYPDSMLGIIAEQHFLTPIIASHLLNAGKVRVAPTLNGNSVIRIEPPLIISDEQIDTALTAIESTVAVLAERNTAALFGHLIDIDVPVGQKREQTLARAKSQRTSNSAASGKFAFLLHPLDVKNYSDFDSSLAAFTQDQLEEIASHWTDMLEPYVISSAEIVSKTGKKVVGDFIVVPYTTAELLAMEPATAMDKIKAAIDLACKRGAQLVGLGAYTSVVTGGGRSLLSHVSVPLTTGNSYTVISGIDALTIGGQELGLNLHESTACIVGAGGAIGKASATLLAEKVGKLILIGNPKRAEKSNWRMTRVVATLYQYLYQQGLQGEVYPQGSIGAYVNRLADLPDPAEPLRNWIEFIETELAKPECPVKITVNLNQNLPEADLILTATSSTETLITPDILKPGALICDMSRPSNVSPDVLHERPDVLVIDGGVIELPGKPDLGWNFGFDVGQAYACMSETIIMALEDIYENTSIGADLDVEYMHKLRDYAEKNGFELAGFRSFDLPLPESVWDQVVTARKQIV